MQSRAGIGRIQHCTDDKCAVLENACLQAVASVTISPNETAKGLEELDRILDSPDDLPLFDKDRLDYIFTLPLQALDRRRNARSRIQGA